MRNALFLCRICAGLIRVLGKKPHEIKSEDLNWCLLNRIESCEGEHTMTGILLFVHFFLSSFLSW